MGDESPPLQMHDGGKQIRQPAEVKYHGSPDPWPLPRSTVNRTLLQDWLVIQRMAHELPEVRFIVDNAARPEELTEKVETVIEQSSHSIELVEIERWGDRRNDHFLFATLRIQGVSDSKAALDVIQSLDSIDPNVSVS